MAQLTNRIPLYFMFDAGESVIGTLISNTLGDTAGTIYNVAKLVPSVAAVPGLAIAGISPTSLKNKTIIPMLVNPSDMSVVKTARVTKILTKRGMLYQYWQSEPDTLHFNGRAAGDRATAIFMQLDSLCKTMENGTRNIVTMIYKFGGVYAGYLENFKTAINADKPGVFDYEFDFTFADKNHFGIFWYAIKSSTLNDALSNPGKFATENLKLGISELKGMSGLSLKI